MLLSSHREVARAIRDDDGVGERLRRGRQHGRVVDDGGVEGAVGRQRHVARRQLVEQVLRRGGDEASQRGGILRGGGADGASSARGGERPRLQRRPAPWKA
jgi:hypothetical protein